jgi:hypothetical protein
VASNAELIVRTLDRHLAGPAEMRLMGGAALVLAYGMDRATEDAADFLMDQAELEAIAESADLGAALEATNLELEPLGLYVSHLWGPEQQILTPEWRTQCRRVVVDPPLAKLSLTALGPLDLVLSKLCRADQGDLDDIRWVVTRERLTADAFRGGVERALVPEAFKDVLPANAKRVLALFSS